MKTYSDMRRSTYQITKARGVSTTPITLSYGETTGVVVGRCLVRYFVPRFSLSEARECGGCYSVYCPHVAGGSCFCAFCPGSVPFPRVQYRGRRCNGWLGAARGRWGKWRPFDYVKRNVPQVNESNFARSKSRVASAKGSTTR